MGAWARLVLVARRASCCLLSPRSRKARRQLSCPRRGRNVLCKKCLPIRQETFLVSWKYAATSPCNTVLKVEVTSGPAAGRCGRRPFWANGGVASSRLFTLVSSGPQISASLRRVAVKRTRCQENASPQPLPSLPEKQTPGTGAVCGCRTDMSWPSSFGANQGHKQGFPFGGGSHVNEVSRDGG